MKRIIKLSILFFITYISFANVSYSEIVKKVNITGNDRLSSRTIMVFGDITINQNYESEDINLIIKKLFDTKFFSDIRIKLEKGVLDIVVKENPIVNLITFQGIKAEKFKKKITELIELREKTPFITNTVKKDIDTIKGFYRHLGYYFVKIDAEVQELKKNRVNLIYSIETGEKAKIAKIFFLGDKKIRDKRLRDIITSQEARFWKFLANTVYLNEGRIELDKRLLKNYYKNRGYYDVQISSSSVEYIEEKGFVLTFSIDAGKRYRFGKIFANVSDSLEKKEFFSLDSEFKKIIGQYYSQRKLAKILEKVDELTERKELQFINHSIIETLEDDKVIVEINIREGRKTFIERINVVGNNVTNESVIRGSMIVDEGDPFSAVLINKSVNNLKSLGIFGNVNSKILPGSKADNSIIEIEIEEKATGEIAAGAGVGTEGTSFNFFVRENNWLGRGIKLRGSFDITQETLRGGIDVTNPNYNYSGNSVSASLNNVKTDRLTTAGYESTKTSTSLGIKFEQYQNIFLSPTISASYENVDADDSASAALKRMEGNYTDVEFGYGITLDKRNQKFQTSDGHRTNFFQKVPLYSDNPTISNGLDFSTYHLFTEDVIGSLKFYGRTINSLESGKDVKVTNRIYLPSSRLRGFKRGKVGPKDGDDHVGGNYAATINLEASLPNLLPEETNTDVSVFFDTANIWGVDYDNSVGKSDTIRAAMGISTNIYTAIGPISMTFAHPVSKASTDETESFSFRIGTSF